MIPGSPQRKPSAMNWAASADLLVHEGPVMSRLSPSSKPPPSILSTSGMPMESHRRRAECIFLPTRPRGRENACNPAVLIRLVCSPGTEAWPRGFMVWSLRTPESCSATCKSQKSPSATVKSGLSRISAGAYSPTRKVAACQLVRNCARRWMKDCISNSQFVVTAFRTPVRREATITRPGWVAE